MALFFPLFSEVRLIGVPRPSLTSSRQNPELLLEAPKEGKEMNIRKESFENVETEVAINSESVLPVPEQLVQPQNNFLTPAIWVAAAVALTIFAVEFGGFSVRDLVQDLLVSN